MLRPAYRAPLPGYLCDMVQGAGHVFVAHGRIECVVHDLAVVPTDADFRVERSWQPLVGGHAEASRPDGWQPGGFARSATDQHIWFVDVVTGVEDGAVETLTARVGELLRAIAADPPAVGAGRTHLRVAMPVLGLEGGGLGGLTGDVVRDLLETLDGASRELGVDVVLVTPEASVFAAAQHVRRERDGWPIAEDLLERATELGALAVRGHLALFLGGGASVPAGLPTWTRLLQLLAERGRIDHDELSRLPELDQAQLLEKRLGPDLGRHVAEITSSADRPSLAHVLLAGLQCQQVVTTNYDQLYERALEATGSPASSILPWDDAEPGHPWILKLHGDISQPQSIVLTRRQFVRYDAATRPAGSVLQALLLTRHLLVVGASLNDDNVSRLAHEVDAFRRERGLESRFGTFVDVGGHPARRELWSDQLHWLSLPGETTEERARALEVFLDCVATRGVREQSWFLDERFEGLLDESARDVAAEARALYGRARQRGRSAGPLLEVLESLGVSGERASRGG